jgi:hypothetical protein
MDEKDFKKHLKDLANGHHHPEEHDWATDAGSSNTAGTAPAKKHAPKRASKSVTRRTK